MDIKPRQFTIAPVKEEDLFVQEISAYFGKPTSGKGSLYWVVRKYGEEKVKTAYLEMEKAGQHKFPYLLQKLK
jgi:hypothetical protein